MSDAILSALNSSQRAAVSSTAQTLAILAGPGSGKTHTLTSRTAWLLQHESLQPWNIIVATFTVKAAKEMKERIGKLIGNGTESKLILGTFHSIARRYLARYGHLINIPKDFGIADSSDSLAIIKRIIKRHKLTIDPPVARSRISSRKAKGGQEVSPPNINTSAEKRLEIQEFQICYDEYEEALKRSNLLDYDDLLLRCVDLLRGFPSCVSNVEAVLIDEFQDTNIVQFDLMRLFAAERKRVTIVGDPDQSIYGFRSAETKNFKRMLRQYPETVTIPLEENYRSSGAILLSALELIQQEEGRIAKSLTPIHIVGTRPVLRTLQSAHNEAEWIVTEIKRILTLTGKLMTYDDISILLRSSSLSRHIESALGKAGIPYRMVGGLRFFDRLEIKILLDYLRVINLPDNNDALARIVNVPARRIGEATVKSLLEEAEKSGTTLWKLILNSVQGSRTTSTKLGKQTEQGLSTFVNIILTARKKVSDQADEQLSPKDLLDHIIGKLAFEDYLERSHPEDYESRCANIQELVNQAADFTDSLNHSMNDEDALPEIPDLQQENLSNPLSKFLANIALASAAEVNECDGPPKTEITISTIHAAKGLEWPVVFIPATYEGSIPHSRAENNDEERRLLYVAMTRAKALLYMSYPCKNSQRERTTLSPFLSSRTLQPHLSNKGPSLTLTVIQSIARILRRPCPAVDIGQASCILQSLDDDIFPLGDEEDEKEQKRNWDDWDGEHHYTHGQQPPKRQRIEIFGTAKSEQTAWKTGYTTTMTKTSSFTVASTTMSTGFISAGSHMTALNDQTEKYANTNVSRAGVSKSTKPRGINGSSGQGSISSFFAPSVSTTTAAHKSRAVSNTSTSTTSTSQISRETQTYSTKSLPHQNRALPSQPSVPEDRTLAALGTHRVGAGSLSHLSRELTSERATGTGLKSKPYVFFSSSPQRPESLVLEAEEEVESTSAPVIYDSTSGMQPAKVMHVTSVQKMGAVMPRRTLGIGRGMKPWSARGGGGGGGGGGGFRPPTFNRRGA